jgi:hypothetical protein
MQNPQDDDHEGHADDIFGSVTYEAPKPQKKDFLPWHKPRKQFVRQHQWCTQINKLLTEVQPADGILKYFGLPGNDLLDLRHFHTQICEEQNIQLRFLGFNKSANPKSEDQTELNISFDEVRKLARIDPLSKILWDDFCNVGNENSVAWDETKKFGPYDIINLDLCDGFGKHKPGELNSNHYNALNNLFAIQSKSPRPWLLFLTTRADKQNIDKDLLQKLTAKYEKNLAECPPFQEASAATFAIDNQVKLKEVVSSPDGHLAVFLVGLCKWMLGIAVQPPASKVEIKSVIGYRVEKDAQHDDLISLALRFDPVFAPTNDPLGIANTPAVLPNECDSAAKAVKRLGKRKSADDILAADANLLGEMVSATTSLLALARYDIAEYHEWLLTN